MIERGGENPAPQSPRGHHRPGRAHSGSPDWAGYFRRVDFFAPAFFAAGRFAAAFFGAAFLAAAFFGVAFFGAAFFTALFLPVLWLAAFLRGADLLAAAAFFAGAAFFAAAGFRAAVLPAGAFAEAAAGLAGFSAATVAGCLGETLAALGWAPAAGVAAPEVAAGSASSSCSTRMGGGAGIIVICAPFSFFALRRAARLPSTTCGSSAAPALRGPRMNLLPLGRPTGLLASGRGKSPWFFSTMVVVISGSSPCARSGPIIPKIARDPG